MHKPEIEIAIKHVDIAGQCVYRPGSMAASDWIHFWESVRDIDFDDAEIIKKKLSEALEEIKILEEMVREMRDNLIAQGDY